MDVSLDARSPAQFTHVHSIAQETCSDFDWFLHRVYPGLIMDVIGVTEEYRSYIHDNGFDEKLLKGQLEQYNKSPDRKLDSKVVCSFKI